MKKTSSILLVLIIVLFGGCGQKNALPDFSTKDYLEGYDQPNSASASWLYPTKDRYYCFGKHDLLYYSEKSSMRWMPLCGKAQCNHNSEDCTACIGTPFLFGQYGDRLIAGIVSFIMNPEEIPTHKIYSMNPDGSEKTLIKEIEYQDGVSLSGVVHRGSVFYSTYDSERNKLNIYTFPLDDSRKEPEQIYEGTGLVIMNGIGPIMNLLILDADGTYLYQYHMIDKTMEKLKTDVFQSVRDVRFCQDGSIMYAKDNTIYLLDPQTLETEEIGTIDGTSFFVDDDFLYVNGEDGKNGYISVFETGASIPFSCPSGSDMFLTTDSDYILSFPNEGDDTHIPNLYMKKSEVLEGKGQWYPIEATYP